MSEGKGGVGILAVGDGSIATVGEGSGAEAVSNWIVPAGAVVEAEDGNSRLVALHAKPAVSKKVTSREYSPTLYAIVFSCLITV